MEWLSSQFSKLLWCRTIWSSAVAHPATFHDMMCMLVESVEGERVAAAADIFRDHAGEPASYAPTVGKFWASFQSFAANLQLSHAYVGQRV